MELPTKVLIGPGVLERLPSFVQDLVEAERLLVVSGPHVKERLHHRVSANLKGTGYKSAWYTLQAGDIADVDRVERLAEELGVELIIGLGGGRSIDVGKLAAYRRGITFLSTPTSASHDGIASPFTSTRGMDKPYSFKAKPPRGILADTQVISSAPRRLLASGCGDLVAKLTAVKDWELARDDVGEYFGKYASSLAQLSAMIVLEEAEAIGQGGEEAVRDVVEALISSGVAAGIAGSSRPCSGAEHLFSHALDILRPGVGLHGEKCGLGTIIMAYLHGLDSDRIREALRAIGAPTKANEVGLSEEDVVEALLLAPKIRPERYTILNRVRLDRDGAKRVVRRVGVI